MKFIFRSAIIAYITWFLLRAAVRSDGSIDAVVANILWGIFVILSVTNCFGIMRKPEGVTQ